MGIENHDSASRDGQRDLCVEIFAVWFGDDPHRGLVGGDRFGKIPGADLAVAGVGVGGQERIVTIIDMQVGMDAAGVGVAGPVVCVAEVDLLGAEDPLDEFDEIPVDDEPVEERVGVGKVVLQHGSFGRFVFDLFPGGKGLADRSGNGCSLLFRVEVFDYDKALSKKGLEICVG